MVTKNQKIENPSTTHKLYVELKSVSKNLTDIQFTDALDLGKVL